MDAALSSAEVAKKQLFEELAESSVNVLRVRALCRDFPGIIATTGLRIRIWTLLLLGPDYKISDDERRDISMPDKACDEQHVLEADVRRTRSEVEDFRSTTWRNAVQSMLQHFCLSHSIQYKQGMNEVLAPFMFIHPPPKGTAVPYALFEAFLFRYLERHLCLDDSSFLFKAFRLFHVLLLYFDPQLALHLKDQDFPPELYSPQWFLTLYSRTLPLQHTLRLWDMIIAVDDPSFTFFIGLCLLRRKREKLLQSDADCIPEIIQDLGFQGEEDIDSVVCEAVSFYKRTPRCLCRYLRLCCVATTQLSSLPVSRSKIAIQREDSGLQPDTERGISTQDRTMSIQAARGCLMLTAKELVTSLQAMSPEGITTPRDKEKEKEIPPKGLGSDNGTYSSTNTGSGSGVDTGAIPVGIWGGLHGGGVGSNMQQFVLVDVRGTAEIESSGGGFLSCAVRLDPEFLDRPDTFAVWLQHLDCMRGCNICIIDMPPVLAPCSKTLWRRLLLGEGDGGGKGRGLLGVGGPKPSTSDADVTGFRDLESTHAAAEKAAIADDSVRPAVRLALALQRDSFPFVCVLEEGYPKFLEQLSSITGTFEPVVLNHDPVKWEKFLISTGRASPTRRPSLNRITRSEIDSMSGLHPERGDRMDGVLGPGIAMGGGIGDHDSKHRLGPKMVVKKKDPLSELEIAQMAYLVAMRLGHKHMELMLLNRVNEVIEKEKKNTPKKGETSMPDSPAEWC